MWEAVHIIEGLLKNTSEVKPTTVHVDTQGQSQPVFGLAHLLGFDLMPRIRNWKGMTFYRPSKTTEYAHIDALFGEVGKHPIDFDLIESQFRHLMRVAVSVREGAISSSTLLKRLRSGSKKNATYAAFRGVGRVIRTVRLLRYLSARPPDAGRGRSERRDDEHPRATVEPGSVPGARLPGMIEPNPKADLLRYLQEARDALLWKLDGNPSLDFELLAGRFFRRETQSGAVRQAWRTAPEGEEENYSPSQERTAIRSTPPSRANPASVRSPAGINCRAACRRPGGPVQTQITIFPRMRPRSACAWASAIRSRG